MSARLLGYFDPGTPDWLAARAKGLGGSEVAAVLGLSPFESRFSLWHRKAGTVGPVDETPEMEWGKRLEPVILGKYADNHPELDFDANAARGTTWCHEDRPWQIANPDALCTDRVVEAKYSIFGDGWGKPGTEEIPIYYRTQVLWYCDTLELDRADVCVLIAGCDYREYTIAYDPDEAGMIRAACEEFLAEVDQGVLPDIDAHSATYQVIRELHPDIDGTDVDLENDLARQYIDARVALAEAEAAERLAKSRIADAMGNAKRARWDGHTIADRRCKEGGVPYVQAGRGLDALATPKETAA